MRHSPLRDFPEAAPASSSRHWFSSILQILPVGRLYALVNAVNLGVFIERDGVLNRIRVDRQHQVSPLTVADFHPNVAAAASLMKLKAAGLLVFATTNQPGLSRGYQSRRELDRMHDLLRASLPLDGILVCPHDDVDECPCRKPKPGLLIEASFNYRIALESSFVVSDKWQDAEAAREVGCTSLMLQSPWIGHVHCDYVMTTLRKVVQKVLALNTARLASVS